MLGRINFPFARDRPWLCKRVGKPDLVANEQNVEAPYSGQQLPLTLVAAIPPSHVESQARIDVAAEDVLPALDPGRHTSSLPTNSTSISTPLNHIPRYPSIPPISSHDRHPSILPTRPEPAHLSDQPSALATPFTASCATLNECCAPRAPAAKPKAMMGLSKSQRIGILLGIDTAFFLIELSVGMLCSIRSP